MAETKAAKITTPGSDPWQSDKDTWQYISVPAENALGEVHASIGLNQHYFHAGQTYLVPKEVAESVQERLHVYARSCVRILQPRRDFDALSKVPLGSASSTSVQHADPSTF